MTGQACAYVDESVRVHAGLYLMAAVFVDDDLADAHRGVLRSLVLPRQRRLHWRDERAARRDVLIRTVAHLDLSGLVMVGTGLRHAKQERARRKVMARLIWSLGEVGIRRVILEARDRVGDVLDRQAVANFNNAYVAPAGMRVHWDGATSEELLWLPDIVAGAAAMAETGDSSYLKQLGDGLAMERFVLD